MAEWLMEDGIGERRAALVEDGRLLEMALEWDGDPLPRAGAIGAARLRRAADATGRGVVELWEGGDALLSPVPPGLTVGGALLVEVVREAIPEGSGVKPPRVRPAPIGGEPCPGPDLARRLATGPHPVRRPGRQEHLSDWGWDEAVEAAETGVVATPDLPLRISLTPAMTLIDVDGTIAPAQLAVAGARAAGAAIRRFDLTGSIGIDLPTLPGKPERQAAAGALDAVLPPPFERTGVNGFGFLQLVRRRLRRSVMERLAADPVGAATRRLLARGVRAGGRGPLTLSAHPSVTARIAAGPGWLDALATQVGAPVTLRPDPRLAISAGDAARLHP
jgi:hypothetical protein